MENRCSGASIWMEYNYFNAKVKYYYSGIKSSLGERQTESKSPQNSFRYMAPRGYKRPNFRRLEDGQQTAIADVDKTKRAELPTKVFQRVYASSSDIVQLRSEASFPPMDANLWFYSQDESSKSLRGGQIHAPPLLTLCP